ncbi:MAG: damage-inducible protein DinB [Holophaga sp.]|nr:damage-inducible protein DinB [Holophaga sp.]
MSIAQALLPEFEHEIAGVRRVLERIPVEHLEYRPHPKSMTLGQLANHLATMPGWIVSTLSRTELDFALPETRALMPEPSTTIEGLLSTLDAGREEASKALAKASDADFQVTWSGKADGKVLFAMPRIAVVRGFVLNHAIHHRAQATVYLRMLDVPVPALYGPSADEA